MSRIVFKLAGVEENEANDVRDLLEELDVAYYETDGGRWRIGVQAIWVTRDEDYDLARQAIDEYQASRSERFQEQWQQNGSRNLFVGFWQRCTESPLHFFMSVLSIAIVLGVTLVPFITLF